LANYELHFRVPQKMQVVAIGNQVEDKVEGDQRVSVWKSETPVRVAGFNYAKFKKLTQVDKDSGMSIEVYTNPGTPDVVRLINQYLEATSEEEGGPRERRAPPPGTLRPDATLGWGRADRGHSGQARRCLQLAVVACLRLAREFPAHDAGLGPAVTAHASRPRLGSLSSLPPAATGS